MSYNIRHHSQVSNNTRTRIEIETGGDKYGNTYNNIEANGDDVVYDPVTKTFTTRSRNQARRSDHRERQRERGDPHYRRPRSREAYRDLYQGEDGQRDKRRDNHRQDPPFERPPGPQRDWPRNRYPSPDGNYREDHSYRDARDGNDHWRYRDQDGGTRHPTHNDFHRRPRRRSTGNFFEGDRHDFAAPSQQRGPTQRIPQSSAKNVNQQSQQEENARIERDKQWIQKQLDFNERTLARLNLEGPPPLPKGGPWDRFYDKTFGKMARWGRDSD